MCSTQAVDMLKIRIKEVRVTQGGRDNSSHHSALRNELQNVLGFIDYTRSTEHWTLQYLTVIKRLNSLLNDNSTLGDWTDEFGKLSI